MATTSSTDRGTSSSRVALRNFRIMAFTTGVVLLGGCVALFFKSVVGVHGMEPWTGYIWVGHGYLYLVYVATVFFLGMKLRWSLLRMALVMAAGTIPTMSFVAEHVVTRDTRKRIAAAETGEVASASTGDER